MTASSPFVIADNRALLEDTATTDPNKAPATGSPGSAAHLLEVDSLSKQFGDLKAVDGVSFHVVAGEVFGLL